MGTKDLPAIIDYILNHTGREKISYIGHSQGTGQLFAAMSLDNSYFAARLNCFMAFGPVSYMGNVTSIFLTSLAKLRLDNLLITFGIFNEFLSDPQAAYKFQAWVCTHVQILCTSILDVFSDVSSNDDDLVRFLVFISHFPSGTSLKSIHHFAQNIRNGGFADLKNDKPYPLKNISGVPISLFVGKDDRLATVADNKLLKEVLMTNNVLAFHKDYDSMGHLTFFLSKTNEHVNDMLPLLEKFNNI
jgi:lysosomal acid lipase/cholesteryl ester hydrolase